MQKFYLAMSSSVASPKISFMTLSLCLRLETESSERGGDPERWELCPIPTEEEETKCPRRVCELQENQSFTDKFSRTCFKIFFKERTYFFSFNLSKILGAKCDFF